MVICINRYLAIGEPADCWHYSFALSCKVGNDCLWIKLLGMATTTCLKAANAESS